MKMRTGYATCGSDFSEYRTSSQLVAHSDIDFGQMAEHADQPLPMIDKNR